MFRCGGHSSVRVLTTLLLVAVAKAATTTKAPCPYAYLAPGQTHTLCLPPNASCHIYDSGVGSGDQKLILDMHNEIRNSVANGKQAGAKNVILPSATNMRQLRWNSELAAIAQAHTDQCLLKADCSKCRSTKDFSTGENLYWEYSSVQAFKQNWAGAVNSWSASSSELSKVTANNYQYSTFTQMIWAQTSDIGCGHTTFFGSYASYQYISYYTCLYGPAGNFIGEDVYEVGKTCSDCAYKNTCCGSNCQAAKITVDYDGLCKLTTA